MPPYRETPKTTERRDAMRARLVAAARARMAAQGVAATTMQQIVADAGTSIGNCYFYFPNKDALFLAVSEEIAAEIHDEIETAAVQVPEGAAELAAVVVVGMQATMARAVEMQRCLVEANQPGVRELFLDNFTRRLPAFLAARFPDVNIPLAVAAWQGTIYAAEDAAFAGAITLDTHALGQAVARWNLRAIGVSEAEIIAALAAVDRIATAGGST